MGKKVSWFSAVKKALTSEPKENKEEKSHKPKKSWFKKHKNSDAISVSEQTSLVPKTHPTENVKLREAENEQNKYAYSVALATAMAAEAAAGVVRLTTITRYPGKSKEEIAAITIQTGFRGYMARRPLRALRGLVRLKSLIQGQSVKRQANTTLRCMQTLAQLQAEIRARRIRMSEENRAFQEQLEQKRVKELERLKASIAEEWDISALSKEQIEAKLLKKQEAAMRRERALAYAYSHQQMWKNSSKSANQTFMNPNNPHWGWSWLERWMAVRPWETRNTIDYHDRASIKSATSYATSIGEITKSYNNKPSPRTPNQKPIWVPNRLSPSTPSKTLSALSVGRRVKSSPKLNGSGGEDDLKSTLSIKSEYFRRHSVAGSSVRDDESLASLSSIPNYMAPTKSMKVRSRLSSPASSGIEENKKSEKALAGSAKKRLSFTASPPVLPRRHSVPRVNSCSIKH